MEPSALTWSMVHEAPLAHISGEQEFLDLHPDEGGPALRALFIGQVGRLLPAADDGQLGGDPPLFQCGHLLLEPLIHGGGDLFAQQLLRHFISLLISRIVRA